MKKNLTEIVFILDRSGSMSGLESDTIGGFNSMIEKQKREGGEALISTVLFDNFSEVIHDRVDIQKITPMTDREYTVRGCTALLDAIGGAIHHIGNVHKYARPEDVPEHTLFVITTDGLENASRREATDDDSLQSWQGRDIYGALVHVPLPAGDHTGRLVNARIVEAKKHSLVAEATGQPW